MDVRECFYCVEALDLLTDEIEKQKKDFTCPCLEGMVRAIKATIAKIEEIG